MLEIRNLVVQIEDKRILNGLDLTVNTGEVHGFLGPNGAGKSTILHMVGGFLAPSSGSVTVGGSPSWGHSPCLCEPGTTCVAAAPSQVSSR